MIIDETALRGALNVLHTLPPKVHSAVYESRKAESMLKYTKALLMKRFNQLPVSAQEREAYASDEFKAAIEVDAKAAADLALLKARLDAAKAAIDIWRTESATERASYG